MFLDEAKIYVKAGDGGAGMVAFRREKYVPYGGPAGGDGGNGGNVVLVVNPKLNTLTRFDSARQFLAENGGKGGSSNRTGASAPDLVIEVPPGTLVRDAETSEFLADLTEDDQQIIVARQGRGGRGNSRFKTSTNQAPRIAEKGEPGEERWLMLELKLLADVGLVGAPNAGKSTLLSVVSAAKPKIAAYPFTTITPNLGMVRLDDRELVVADIPGLIEGAHQGVGLGHSFLRHIQRTRLLIHLLDGASENPVGDFVQISSELALFDPTLAEKPQIVVLNKMDLPQAQTHLNQVRAVAESHSLPFFEISAVTHQGVNELMMQALEIIANLPEPEPVSEIPVFAPLQDEDAFKVFRVNGNTFRVTGKRIERAAAQTYWEYEEAVARFQRILGVIGVTEALREAGVHRGDTVIIGEYELEWAE